MPKRIKYYCDKCGKETDPGNVIELGFTSNKHLFQNEFGVKTGFDLMLCGNCFDKFYPDFIGLINKFSKGNYRK